MGNCSCCSPVVKEKAKAAEAEKGAKSEKLRPVGCGNAADTARHLNLAITAGVYWP